MSTMKEYTYITLKERPETVITSTTFETKKALLSDLIESQKPSQVLVHTNWISLDPAMRGWLNDARSYVPPVQIGETMRASAISTVVKAASSGSRLKVGDVVSAVSGWAEYVLVEEKDALKLEVSPNAEILDYLGPLGLTGLTAYFGLLEVGKPKAGETLVVTGAAGATGSIVCQIGKLKGLKVIAVAGSDEKCEWLEKELGVDKAINYKSSTFAADLKKSAGYLDIMFDNVGGEILNLCLTTLNKHARIVLCGAISQYNTRKSEGLTAYLNLITQSASIQGFIILNYAAQFSVARKDMMEWIAQGKIKRKFHIVEGIEKCPESLALLFEGTNTGKLVVKVAESKKLANL